MNRRTLFPILTALPAAIATAISQSKAIPANNAAKELHIGGQNIPDGMLVEWSYPPSPPIPPIPTKAILDVANEIREHLSPLPDGYYVNSDLDTGFVIVHTQELGFAITVNTIRDCDYLYQAKESFGRLVMAVDQHRKYSNKST